MKLYQLISENDARKMLAVVSSMPWSEGKARTKALTGTVKQNLEILASDSRESKALLGAVSKELLHNQAIGLDWIPYKIHAPKFNKYMDGGQYLPHTDAPWMKDTRTDVSCTVFLSEPDSYEGGELCIEGRKIKGKPGQALLYTCDKVHSVAPVTKGERVCVVTWIQSRIRDPIKRKMISDFRKWLAKMEGTELFDEGSVIYSALLKRWME